MSLTASRSKSLSNLPAEPLVAPNPHRIDSFSPTLINDLASCGYQAAFRLDEKFKDLDRPNTFSSLGVVRHKIEEKVHSGELNDVEDSGLDDAIEELWEGAVAEAARRLTEAWAPVAPPSPEDWPGYQLARARARVQLRRDVANFRQSRGSGDAPRVERWLEDKQLGLGGKPDRVEFRHGSPVVVDLKSGPTQEQIRPEQRRQLLLYAHLVAIRHGTTPATIAIDTSTGKRYSEQITESDIADAVQGAVGLVNAFNDRLGDSFEPLANPSADTCRYCDYRSECRPFWSSLRRDWGQWSVRGKVTGAETVGSGTGVTIDVESPPDWPSRTCSVAPVIHDILPPNSTNVAFVDAAWTVGWDKLRTSWSTIVRFW